jgi:hypothetical protein
MRSPRSVAADMVKAMDAAMKEVWDAEPKQQPRDEGLKRQIFQHVCNNFARRGGYGQTEITD